MWTSGRFRTTLTKPSPCSFNCTISSGVAAVHMRARGNSSSEAELLGRVLVAQRQARIVNAIVGREAGLGLFVLPVARRSAG